MPRSPAMVSIGIAGDQADQHEHEQRDPDEGRDHEADPGEDEPEHAVPYHPPRKAEAAEKKRRRSRRRSARV